jgi:hypothetical protein
MYNWKYKNMEKSRKPNGKNIEIALELLELSLFLKNAVKKQRRKNIVNQCCPINTFISSVISARAGIQNQSLWIPVSTGMTKEHNV